MGTRLPALREYIRDIVGDPAVDGESFDRASPQTYMAERARNDPTSQNLNTLDEMLLLRGGAAYP